MNTEHDLAADLIREKAKAAYMKQRELIEPDDFEWNEIGREVQSDWIEIVKAAEAVTMRDVLARRIGLEVGESRGVVIRGQRYTMTRTQ